MEYTKKTNWFIEKNTKKQTGKTCSRKYTDFFKWENRHTVNIFLFTLLILGFNFALIKKAQAQVIKENIVMEPPFQEIVLNESSTEQIAKIKLTNNTKENIEFSFQILEIKQMDEQGNISFIDKPQTSENPLAWFIEAPQKILIEKNTNTTLDIKIKNSADLSPGGHYTALVAKSNPISETQLTQVSPALSSFILVRKEGGVIYQLSLKPLEKLGWLVNKIPTTFKLTFDNHGNSHTIPRGTIEIKDIFNQQIQKGIINEASSIVLPGARRNIQVNTYEVDKRFPIMYYTVTIKGTTNPGDVKFEQNSSFIYVAPYTYIAATTLSLVGVLVIIKKRAKKY